MINIKQLNEKLDILTTNMDGIKEMVKEYESSKKDSEILKTKKVYDFGCFSQLNYIRCYP